LAATADDFRITGGNGMTYQFKSEVTAGDFWKLTMSRTYRSVAGVCNMVFTVAMILQQNFSVPQGI
jgi:hypothetical protein